VFGKKLTFYLIKRLRLIKSGLKSGMKNLSPIQQKFNHLIGKAFMINGCRYKIEFRGVDLCLSINSFKSWEQSAYIFDNVERRKEIGEKLAIVSMIYENELEKIKTYVSVNPCQEVV
jgi:hypothetical protein